MEEEERHYEKNDGKNGMQFEATIAELKLAQSNMMKMLLEQQEVNSLLRDFIRKSHK